MSTAFGTDVPTDEQLIADACQEDSDGPAFVELVARHGQRVWSICFRLMGNEEDAHDAAQEVFVRTFFGRTKFAGRSKFSTWLHSIAVKTCLELRRARSRRWRREARLRQQSSPEPERRHDSQQLAEAIDLTTMLATLTEDDRALLLMKYSEGYTYEELAEIFELSVSACKMRVSRACDKLEARFGSDP